MSWSAQIPALLTDFKRFLKTRGKSPEDAEDLIQEAFLRLEQYCRQGKEIECAEAFLRRTVLNLAVSEHRHEARFRQGRIELDPGLVDPHPTPDEVLQAEQRLIQMKDILDAVSPRTREAYFLHRLGGFSYADIAQRLNCSVSMVEKHIARAYTAITYARCHGTLKET